MKTLGGGTYAAAFSFYSFYFFLQLPYFSPELLPRQRFDDRNVKLLK